VFLLFAMFSTSASDANYIADINSLLQERKK